MQHWQNRLQGLLEFAERRLRHYSPPVVRHVTVLSWSWLQIHHVSVCLFVCVWLSLGPISSILVNKYGSRPVMIAGGCLSGLGLIAASFCNSVQALYFCIGVVGGTPISFFFQILMKIRCLVSCKICHILFFILSKHKSINFLLLLCRFGPGLQP